MIKTDETLFRGLAMRRYIQPMTDKCARIFSRVPADLGLLLGIGFGGFLSVLPMQASQAQIALPPQIETQSLTADVLATGTLSAEDGALPVQLWEDSDPQTLGFLLDHAPGRPAHAAIGEALRRILLSPGQVSATDSQAGARQNLGGKKLLALVNAGFIKETRTLASLSDAPQNDPFTGKALALADLLEKQEVSACGRSAALATERAEIFWVKLRSFCYVISGERDAADLTLSLLRDSGRLEAREDDFLTAMITGVAPKKALLPRSPLELAIVRALNLPIVPGLLKEADGSVIRAITQDDTINASMRIKAARLAVSNGTMSVGDFAALLSSIPLDVAALGAPLHALNTAPTDPITDAIVWQVVSSMTQPEFLGAKAELISNVLGVPAGFEQSFALHRLYADEVARLDGALIAPEHAARFARARMAVGDGAGAGRWLVAMRGEGDISGLGEHLSGEFIALTNMLYLLDPVGAQLVAQSAQTAISDPRDEHSLNSNLEPGGDATLPAKFTRAVFDAAMVSTHSSGQAAGEKKYAQAGLAALALSDHRISGANPVQDVVREQGFAFAGLGDISRNLALQEAWKLITPKVSILSKPVIPARVNDGLTPSLKPRP